MRRAHAGGASPLLPAAVEGAEQVAEHRHEAGEDEQQADAGDRGEAEPDPARVGPDGVVLEVDLEEQRVPSGVCTA